MSNILIHIGKSGGSTCRQAIRASAVVIDEIVHITKPPIRPDRRYYIVARHPIDRAVSAFNWRYKLVVAEERQKHRFEGEHAVLATHGTLNALAEQLYDAKGAAVPEVHAQARRIHHLKEDIDFYLDDLLAVVGPQQIAGVVMQESLEADLLAVFGVRTDIMVNRNRHTSTAAELHLSPAARANLRRFLAADFRCLEVLRRWGKISPAGLAALDRR